MKRLNVLFALVPVLVFVLAFSYKVPDDNSKGKELFTANKCGTCHSVESAGITKKGKGPDLSQLSDTVKSDWIQKFLKKQQTLSGKAHPLAFKGSDDDLKTLSGWIVSLNSGKKSDKKRVGIKDQSGHDIMRSMEKMHNEMSESEISGNADRDFAHLMIHHHQGAIDLSNYELKNGSDRHIKDFAKKSVRSQESDIDKLKEFDNMSTVSSTDQNTSTGMASRQDSVKETDINTARDKQLADITNSDSSRSQITGSSSQMNTDRDMIESMHDKMNEVDLSGNTDKDFVALMIKHHQAAIDMADNYLSRIQDSRLKEIAKNIIESNQKDIDELQNLKKD